MNYNDEKMAQGNPPPPPPFRLVPYFMPPIGLFSDEQMKEVYIKGIELLQNIAIAEQKFYGATLEILKH
jgi:hypothetical protein